MRFPIRRTELSPTFKDLLRNFRRSILSILGNCKRKPSIISELLRASTLRIAEKLYLKALILIQERIVKSCRHRYSRKLYCTSLVSTTDYSKLINSLLSEPSRRRFPWQGPGEDPAHPAIHPTGEIPRQSLSLEEKKIFDLVVRRFCNAFAPDAIVEKVSVIFNISSHEFLVEWENIVDEGWMKYYVSKRPSRPKLNQDLNVGEQLEIDKATMKERYTTLPPRYNEGSLLYRMESEGIGTKATRAETISTLIKRRYVGNSRDLVPGENALVLIHQLRKDCPEIVSPEMTRFSGETIDVSAKRRSRAKRWLLLEN